MGFAWFVRVLGEFGWVWVVLTGFRLCFGGPGAWGLAGCGGLGEVCLGFGWVRVWVGLRWVGVWGGFGCVLGWRRVWCILLGAFVRISEDGFGWAWVGCQMGCPGFWVVGWVPVSLCFARAFGVSLGLFWGFGWVGF